MTDLSITHNKAKPFSAFRIVDDALRQLRSTWSDEGHVTITFDGLNANQSRAVVSLLVNSYLALVPPMSGLDIENIAVPNRAQIHLKKGAHIHYNIGQNKTSISFPTLEDKQVPAHDMEAIMDQLKAVLDEPNPGRATHDGTLYNIALCEDKESYARLLNMVSRLIEAMPDSEKHAAILLAKDGLPTTTGEASGPAILIRSDLVNKLKRNELGHRERDDNKASATSLSVEKQPGEEFSAFDVTSRLLRQLGQQKDQTTPFKFNMEGYNHAQSYAVFSLLKSVFTLSITRQDGTTTTQTDKHNQYVVVQSEGAGTLIFQHKYGQEHGEIEISTEHALNIRVMQEKLNKLKRELTTTIKAKSSGGQALRVIVPKRHTTADILYDAFEPLVRGHGYRSVQDISIQDDLPVNFGESLKLCRAIAFRQGVLNDVMKKEGFNGRELQ